MSTAPNCEWPGCNNSTWSPDGRCPAHRGKTIPQSFGSEHGQDRAVPHVSNSDKKTGETPEQIYEGVRGAFPDIDPRIHPYSIREQSENNLKAAVSIEVYRKFPDADYEDRERRDNQLQFVHSYITENSLPSNVEFDDNSAATLSTATDDVYGPGFEDSVGLTSYGIRREWDLARSMDIEKDENGVPYGDSYSDYLENVESHFTKTASDEYMRQLVRFPRIIYDVKDEYPRCKEGIFPNQDMEPEIRRNRIRMPSAPDFTSQEYQDRAENYASDAENEPNEFKRMAKIGGKTILGMIMKAAEEHKERFDSFPERERQAKARLQEQKAQSREENRARKNDRLREKLLKNEYKNSKYELKRNKRSNSWF